MPPDLRPARSDEAGQLAALDAAADAYPWSISRYSSALSGSGGQRVFVTGTEVACVASVVFAVAAGQGSIHRIVVGSDQRRRGLGSALLRAALAAMRTAGARECLLEVRESNTPARRLYEREGFSLDGRRKGYYTQPGKPQGREDALLMSLSLED